MASPIHRVQPGDLITAFSWNEVVDKLQDLETRLAVVEAAGMGSSVAIISVTSDATPIRVGMRITVHGRNFAQPASLNAVSISGVPVPASSFTFASSDTELIFDVPAVPNLAQSGSMVTLTVTNSNGSASTQFMLFPAQQLAQGRLETLYTRPPVMPAGQTNISAGASWIFQYAIRAFVNRDETYAITPAIAAPGWTAELLQDIVNAPLVPARLMISAGNPTERTVRVRVNIPPGAAGSGVLDLNVSATTPGASVLPGIASPVTIAVNQPPPTPETRVRISLRPGANIQNERVVFTRNQPGGVSFTVSVTEAAPTGSAPYVVSGATSGAGWTVNNPIAQFNATNASEAAPANQNVTAVLTPAANATNTDLILTVTRASAGVTVSYALPIAVI
jgi:IPT/TIG domain